MADNPTNMPNAEASLRLHRLLDEMLVEASRRGWYGKLVLTVSVQDGILQSDMSGESNRKFVPPRK